MQGNKVRILMAKVGLDGHDRGAKVVARALMESGMEVVYTGLRKTVEQVVDAAVQEDVDVVGLSFMAGDHLVIVPKIMKKLAEKRSDPPIVIVGGIILREDIPELEKHGVEKVFGPGTFSREIIRYLQNRFDLVGNE